MTGAENQGFQGPVSGKTSPFDPVDLLRFELPTQTDLKGWDAAEKEGFKFPDRLLRKARELRECRQERDEAWQESQQLRDRLYGFVVRNLIGVADNCKFALTAAREESTTPAKKDSRTNPTEVAPTTKGSRGTFRVNLAPSSPPEETPSDPEKGQVDTPPPAASPVESQDLAHKGLESVYRSVLYILEELGIQRVELLGLTYDNVIVNGQQIEDPFEVLESSQKGKTSEITVREVVGDLWVRDRSGHLEVLQKGKVIC